MIEDDPFPPLAERALERFEHRLERLIDDFQALIAEGVADGSFRPVSLGDMTQSVVGLLVFHFASGEFGERVIAGPIFSQAAIARRRDEVKSFIRHGLLAEPG